MPRATPHGCLEAGSPVVPEDPEGLSAKVKVSLKVGG